LNWIKLLYPPPHFDLQFGLVWMRKIHVVALTIAYYLTHTLALVGLTLIYFLCLIPLKLWFIATDKDPLQRKYDSNLKSYLKISEDLTKMDFKRMY
jgi:hypothetical protein